MLPFLHFVFAAGIQPGIGKGDRKRRLQGFEVLLARQDVKKDATNSAGGSEGEVKSDSAAVADAVGETAANDPNVAAAISAHRGREAARDKRALGGLAPSLIALLWEHQLPAALAAGVAAAAQASEESVAAASALARRGDGASDLGGVGEGPTSAAAALVFAAVRQVMR